MALIKSISGIRGTIGGMPGDNLSPLDMVRFTAAYGSWLKEQIVETASTQRKKVVIGRDGRISGAMVQSIVMNTLLALGIDVIDLDLSTTPTVEMAVKILNADGGIILTASHNPKEWNALKLLNHRGEFISGDDGTRILALAAEEKFLFADVDNLGTYQKNEKALQQHIEAVVNYSLVDVDAIKKANFKIVLDAINSTGATAVPALLKALGVEEIVVLNGSINGQFAHNPEPLPEHLNQLCNEVNKQKAHLGIAVDPDVDRLCFVCEDGSLFGEEYTLVAVADYVLRHRKGNTVSNLSSTRALRDVTEKQGGQYFPSAVGEVNVVNMMKEMNAVIGGEGNGGIIYPELHYGRDALVGIALFLTSLSKSGKTCTALRMSFPNYIISKNKVDLTKDIDADDVLNKIKEKYKKFEINTIDGVRIDFDEEWIHLRKSNTEPIIRIYAESKSETTARNLTMKIIKDIGEIANK